MSGTNINKEFADFGKRMNVIAILSLLSLIVVFIGIFFWPAVLIGLIFSLIIIIFFLLVIGNIKRAGRELNNKELLDFTPRFLFGTIIRFIGQASVTIGLVFLENPWIMVGIGVVLIIVGCILRYKAWGCMQGFFETNAQLFPQDISMNGSKGSKLCKIGALLDLIAFFPLDVIGKILRIIGYFKLASSKNLLGAPAQPIYQPAEPQPISTQAPSAPSANFCPDCGSPVSSGARFCPGCGSSIN